jgi:hypothetical protein
MRRTHIPFFETRTRADAGAAPREMRDTDRRFPSALVTVRSWFMPAVYTAYLEGWVSCHPD